jgi:hypothetical protein
VKKPQKTVIISKKVNLASTSVQNILNGFEEIKKEYPDVNPSEVYVDEDVIDYCTCCDNRVQSYLRFRRDIPNPHYDQELVSFNKAEELFQLEVKALADVHRKYEQANDFRKAYKERHRQDRLAKKK